MGAATVEQADQGIGIWAGARMGTKMHERREYGSMGLDVEVRRHG